MSAHLVRVLLDVGSSQIPPHQVVRQRAGLLLKTNVGRVPPGMSGGPGRPEDGEGDRTEVVRWTSCEDCLPTFGKRDEIVK